MKHLSSMAHNIFIYQCLLRIFSYIFQILDNIQAIQRALHTKFISVGKVGLSAARQV